MATNKDAPDLDRPMTEDTPRSGPCGNTENLKKTECHGNGGDPIDAAHELLRIAEDSSLSPRERFRQVDKAADALLASFPGPRDNSAGDEAPDEIGDEAYDATSEESAREYVESFVAQAKDIVEIGLDKIIEGLSVPTGVLPEKAIRQAQKHRELIIPRLIRILEETAAASEIDPSENNAHFFALYLLAEFEAHEAFPAIRNILSLTDDLPYELFGETITEDLPKILAPFTWNRPELLEEMMSDISLDESVRYGAAMTITSLVAADRLPWEEGARMLGRGVTKDAEENGAETFDYFQEPLSNILIGKAVREMDRALSVSSPMQTERIMEIIEEAIADPEMRRDPDPTCPKECPGVEDTVDEVRDWCCFRNQNEESAGLKDSDSPPAPHFLQNRAETAPVSQPIVSGAPRTGRNQPCPCGSGKKYKKCCGANH